jgi:transketolase
MEYSIDKNSSNHKVDDETLFKIAQNARSLIIKMVYSAKSGHPGGSLSIIDVLTHLYFDEMNIDPLDQDSEDRDRLIMSKGHASPALYSILSLRGYFPQELLMDFRKINSKLEGHVHRGVPGVEASTGSLGQGLGIGVGAALSSKIDHKSFRVFVILGDGEIEEGNIWESLMAASKYKLTNLIAILDRNRIQLDGFTEDIMPMGSIVDKVKAFGWDVFEFNGNSFSEIREVMKNINKPRDKPLFLIANTIKGKGVSYMENNYKYHGSPPSSQEEYDLALKEIGARKYE